MVRTCVPASSLIPYREMGMRHLLVWTRSIWLTRLPWTSLTKQPMFQCSNAPAAIPHAGWQLPTTIIVMRATGMICCGHEGTSAAQNAMHACVRIAKNNKHGYGFLRAGTGPPTWSKNLLRPCQKDSFPGVLLALCCCGLGGVGFEAWGSPWGLMFPLDPCHVPPSLLAAELNARPPLLRPTSHGLFLCLCHPR